MHPRFKAGLGIFNTMILASVAFLMSAAATPLTAPAEGACPEQAELRPVMIDVPADGTVSFGIADLAPSAVNALTCVEMAAIEASSFVAHASEGVVAVVPGPQLAMAGWTGRGVLDTTQRFEFTPKPGFSGVSQGWEFAIYTTNGAGERVRIGAVMATFQVKNIVPVANDDAVTVDPHAGGFAVGAGSGVLANDVDANGDSLVVHSCGVTSFPWGSVEIHHDGSYQVTVNDPDLTGTEQVRYVVWDQEGSTASADTGILTLTFAEGAEAHAAADRHTARKGHGAAPDGNELP